MSETKYCGLIFDSWLPIEQNLHAKLHKPVGLIMSSIDMSSVFEILKRKEKSKKMFRYFPDNIIAQNRVINHERGQVLIDRVIDFFENGSELIYPAKFVFCNIVYAYYLNKYFNLDFYECLDTYEILADSPSVLLYSQAKQEYDTIINHVIDHIEHYKSIEKTRLFFMQEFLIFGENNEFQKLWWE